MSRGVHDVILLHPIYLLLAVPLVAALFVWPPASRVLAGLRLVTLALVLAALAGLALYLPSDHGTVVVIADRSQSLPADAEQRQKDAIELLQKSMMADDRLAIVAFGRTAAVERAPSLDKFPGFVNDVGSDASNLAEAIDLGLGLIPKGAPGRLLVLSDGQWTGRDPAQAAARGAERGVAIDHRVLERGSQKDVAIARIDAPSTVNPGESFLITAWVFASEPQEVAYEFRRGDVRLGSGRRKLETGLNRFTFRDSAEEPGTLAYALTLAAKENDAVPENDSARLLVGVDGAKPLLVVTGSASSNFPAFLEAGGLSVRAKSPKECVWSLEELSNYAGVVLENVPADTLGHRAMETLGAWLQETGSGLMLTGGRASFGQGGYYKSPLDPLLPVSMELRQEHRKLSLAIVVALDRSGSMAMPVGGGRVKMDLANLGAAQVVDLLGPLDEFGCIAVDSAPHLIQPLEQIQNKAAVRGKILSINSQGGGIYVYEALEESLSMIRKAKAGAKHIILFSDAADAEEPKAYKDLLKAARAEGVTVSVIGLGKDTDKDGELLKDVAKLGNGRCFFTDVPDELPRLFAQDTFVVARNAFLTDPTPIKSVAGITTIANRDFKPPEIGGYNLCYLRPNATLGVVTLDEYKAPVVAAWQSGAGRVLCYTGEADGKYTGPLGQWKDAGDFFSSLARWTVGRTGSPISGVTVTQERNKGVATVKIHLDPDRKQDPFAVPPEVSILRSVKNKKPSIEKIRAAWTGGDTLAVDIPLSGPETALATVAIEGRPPIVLSPVCLPYSPEFEPATLRDIAPTATDDLGETRSWGAASLENVSRLTGGQERIELPTIWRDLPRQPRLVALAPWLLVGATVVFLAEILQRLTGLFTFGLPRRKAVAAEETVAAPISAAPAAIKIATPQAPESVAPTPAPEPQGGLLDALKQVQRNKRRP